MTRRPAIFFSFRLIFFSEEADLMVGKGSTHVLKVILGGGRSLFFGLRKLLFAIRT